MAGSLVSSCKFISHGDPNSETESLSFDRLLGVSQESSKIVEFVLHLFTRAPHRLPTQSRIGFARSVVHPAGRLIRDTTTIILYCIIAGRGRDQLACQATSGSSELATFSLSSFYPCNHFYFYFLFHFLSFSHSTLMT